MMQYGSCCIVVCIVHAQTVPVHNSIILPSLSRHRKRYSLIFKHTATKSRAKIKTSYYWCRTTHTTTTTGLVKTHVHILSGGTSKISPASCLQLSAVCNHTWLDRPVTPSYLGVLNFLYYVHALHNLPEHNVLAIQPRRWDCAQEELATVGVFSSVSHT